jgi:hypothetical protein
MTHSKIFKRYTFAANPATTTVGAHSISFSSSAGFLSSVDDFYIVHPARELSDPDFSKQLVVVETSLDVFDPVLIAQITPRSLLSWVRVRTANHLARSGEQWAELFSRHHSGTYVNQWMVLDESKFEPSRHAGEQAKISPGLFTVLEELPTMIHSEDLTTKLVSDGYWGSFNQPFFSETYEKSGDKFLCQKAEADSSDDGPAGLDGKKKKSKIGFDDPYKREGKCSRDFNYDNDPRGRIFKRDHASVTDVASMLELMNYNDYRHDPLSNGDPCAAIACRVDLEAQAKIRKPYGAVDGKNI